HRLPSLFFFQAKDGIRAFHVTGVQTCALPIYCFQIRSFLLENSAYLSVNMQARGGGVLDIELVDLTAKEPDFFQLKVSFETCDRSEERRVGKESRFSWCQLDLKQMIGVYGGST